MSGVTFSTGELIAIVSTFLGTLCTVVAVLFRLMMKAKDDVIAAKEQSIELVSALVSTTTKAIEAATSSMEANTAAVRETVQVARLSGERSNEQHVEMIGALNQIKNALKPDRTRRRAA